MSNAQSWSSSTSPPLVASTFWPSGGKHLFDLLAASMLLVVFSPVVLIAALLIKLTSRGRVLFHQNRAGWNGEIFRLYKLRTMRGGRTPDPKEIVPLSHPEITNVGRWLRRLKIDEIPQLMNVLRGEMSLIGPRPTLPDQVEAYDDFRRQRLLVRPGITGLAQVYASNTVSWDQRILFDIAYVRRCSLLMDMGILLRTLAVVVLGEDRMSCPFRGTRYARFIAPPPGYGENGTTKNRPKDV